VDLQRLEAALRRSRADAAWVGWGFVAERPEFAELCERLGIVFIGPTAAAMRRLGDKIASKRLADDLGVPLAPWSGGCGGRVGGGGRGAAGRSPGAGRRGSAPGCSSGPVRAAVAVGCAGSTGRRPWARRSRRPAGRRARPSAPRPSSWSG